MIIKNGTLLNEDFEFVKADIAFGEKIEKIGPHLNGEQTFDASNCYVVPGLVDTHMHGAVGENFLEFTEETVTKICGFEAKSGTTSLVPAISAAIEEKMISAIKNIAATAGQYNSTSSEHPSAKMMGIHLEGPFFSLQYKGAHLPENIRKPTTEEFDRLLEAGEGMVKIITMAPELENGCALIRHAAERDVTVSIGHTSASYEEALAAFAAGATQTTHTFNAMSPLNHRSPGVVGAAMMHESAQCELICDFFHVHKDVVKLLYTIKGADRITMITDSERGAGMPDGEFMLSGRKIIVKDRKTYAEDGVIAGGSTVLLDGVKNLISIGIPLAEAVKMASKNGAKAAGIYDQVGSLAVGKDADILILDQNLNVKKVFVNGIGI